MSTTLDKNCTILLLGAGTEKNPPSQEEILKGLESNKVDEKIKGAKSAILSLLNGESMPRVLMYVIRFCSTHESHQLKKLLMIYWEIAQKYDANKKLLPEMILVCNALLNDLNHPNEFIRGSMLRFLCKIKEPELLEPLKDAVKSNLEHRHSYVRRNAVMAVYMIYKNFGDQLIPDAPDLIEKFIVSESDSNARRNAFIMLFETAEDLAIKFLMNSMDQVQKFGDGFSLVILELTRKVCRKDPTQKSRFIRCIFQLLNSSSAAVSYEAAWTLVTLSSAPTAVRAAAKTYAGLLGSQSDNNIKLIVLERLQDLKKYHRKVLQELLMDIMRTLSSPNVAVCEKVLDITMDLLSPRNIDGVVQVLKREVLKTQDASMDKSTEYRHLLIKAIHSCAIKFPNIANQVVHTLMEFISNDGAMDVILFVRAICESYPDMRHDILEKLVMSFGDIESGNVARVALWIMGEYSENETSIQASFKALKESLGNPEFHAAVPQVEENTQSVSSTVSKSVVLADGTYATETVYSPVERTGENGIPALRNLLIAGDFFLASSVASTFTKLCLRLMVLMGNEAQIVKNMLVDSIKYMCGFIIFGQSNDSKIPIDLDSTHRISMCIRILAQPKTTASCGKIILESCRESYSALLNLQMCEEENQKVENKHYNQVDDLISIRQLRGKKALGSTDIDIDDGADISRATGGPGGDDFSGKIKHVNQLTGFADPVYAEASVTVLDYDIVLEILVINRTPQTLNNLTIELSTMGDLKLVERPSALTIGPFDQRVIKANIKVSSTETGHIFGTIVYESASGADKTYVNLNDIHLDIMDYIVPATCTDSKFRSMWAEFEWENKVAINTEITDIVDFLDHTVKNTHMRCLTPTSALEGETNFLAANLYAKSIFGEDALANLSIEKQDSGKISGYIRIRSKTQGIALSLGDRITSFQRLNDNNERKTTEKQTTG